MSGEELSLTERELVEEVLGEATVGHLGILTPGGYPRVVPLNFAAQGATVYFHGATRGEKAEALSKSPRVTFSAIVAYSAIPSYWIMEGVACPAGQFFKSVQINGTGHVVQDLEEKARSLQGFMDKYQPEGQFLPIATTEPIYEQLLGAVQVFRIDPEAITVRSKFGQNQPEALRRDLIKRLEERNEGMDLRTAEELRKTLEA